MFEFQFKGKKKQKFGNLCQNGNSVLTLNAEISEFPCVLVEFFALVGYFETSVGLLLQFITVTFLKKVQYFFWES